MAIVRAEAILLTSMRISTTVLATASAMPNTMPAASLQPNARAGPHPATPATALCADRARDRDAPHAQQLLRVEMHADPNISRITPISAICAASCESATKPGRERPHHDAREHVAHQRREPDALGEPAEHERDGESAREGGDQGEVMHLSIVTKEKGRERALLQFTAKRRPYAATRLLYSLVRVSISMRSPVSQNAGTCTRWPVASLAGFSTLPEVSPRTAGSV